MQTTDIKWTDATWNPVTGCTKVSAGCRNCYAERVAGRFWKGRAFTDVLCHEDRLAEPLRWRKPKRIFVNSMSDLFHEAVPFEFVDRVFVVMMVSHEHTFQLLTKRPERMREYISRSYFPGRLWDAAILSGLFGASADQIRLREEVWPLLNVWLGVSVEDQATADERIPALLQCPVAVRFVSYEPALGPMDPTKIGDDEIGATYDALRGGMTGSLDLDMGGPRLDWVIAGGESGPNARPAHPQWFRAVRDACEAAAVPFFFKQWGEYVTEDQSPEDIVLPGTSIKPRAWKSSDPFVFKVGKARAGLMLDGREHNEFPGGDRTKSQTHPPIPPNCEYLSIDDWGPGPQGKIPVFFVSPDVGPIIPLSDPGDWLPIIAAVAEVGWLREGERIDEAHRNGEISDDDWGFMAVVAERNAAAWREWLINA